MAHKRNIKAIILAVMEVGVHLFPSRTQQLSLSSPMLLRFDRGKVGRCQDCGFYFARIYFSGCSSVSNSVFARSFSFTVREVFGL